MMNGPMYGYAKTAWGWGRDKGFWRKLFCFHVKWFELPVKDWRSNEGYWQCKYCGKIKNFGFSCIPIDLETD